MKSLVSYFLLKQQQLNKVTVWSNTVNTFSFSSFLVTHYIIQVGLYAVSYTHLDVYKRQHLSYVLASLKCLNFVPFNWIQPMSACGSMNVVFYSLCICGCTSLLYVCLYRVCLYLFSLQAYNLKFLWSLLLSSFSCESVRLAHYRRSTRHVPSPPESIN